MLQLLKRGRSNSTSHHLSSESVATVLYVEGRLWGAHCHRQVLLILFFAYDLFQYVFTVNCNLLKALGNYKIGLKLLGWPKLSSAHNRISNHAISNRFHHPCRLWCSLTNRHRKTGEALLQKSLNGLDFNPTHTRWTSSIWVCQWCTGYHILKWKNCNLHAPLDELEGS